MAAKTPPKRIVELRDEELQEVLSLASGADSVELKLTVPEADHRSAIQALELDPLDAQIRLVSFFDTPDLTLNKLGLIVRARRVQGREDDTVIKLRPVVPDELPARCATRRAWSSSSTRCPAATSARRRSRRALAAAPRCEARGRRSADAQAVLQVAAGVLRAHAPDGPRARRPPRPRADLRAQAQPMPKDFGRKLVAELWLYPDGSRILELSTKCAPAEMFQVAAEARGVPGRARHRPLGPSSRRRPRPRCEQFSRNLPTPD